MNPVEDDERRRCWRAHCFRMAEASYALADTCDDLDALRGHIAEAAAWVNRAERPPA